MDVFGGSLWGGIVDWWYESGPNPYYYSDLMWDNVNFFYAAMYRLIPFVPMEIPLVQGGGGGSSTQAYWPSLSEANAQVVSSASSVAVTRMGAADSDCGKFVNGLLSKMSDAISDRGRFMLNFLTYVSGHTTYFNGTTSQLIVTYQNQPMTLQALFSSHPNIMAHTENLQGATTVFMNSSFFSSPDQQASTLIHEWFHGIDSQTFTDQALAGLLGWNQQGDASQYLSDRFFTNCGH